MNEKLLKVLSTMFPETNFVPFELNGAKQIHFINDTHECSITIFQEDKNLATLKNACKNDNDIAWLDNVRFSATSY